MVKTLDDIKRANKRAGRHFFDAETMAHWNSVVYPEVFDAGDEVALFITSEAPEGQRRRYAVRISQGNGCVKNLTRMRTIRTHEMAVVIATRVARWWLTDTGPESGTVDEWVARAVDSDQ